MFARIFKEVIGRKLALPFRHMKYEDAVKTYGSDKPDLRFDNKIVDITKELEGTQYNILKRVVETKGHVKVIAFDAKFDGHKGRLDKNYMLKMIELAKLLGLRGLTWLYVKDNVIHSEPESIADSFKNCEAAMRERLGAKNGDIIIMGVRPVGKDTARGSGQAQKDDRGQDRRLQDGALLPLDRRIPAVRDKRGDRKGSPGAQPLHISHGDPL